MIIPGVPVSQARMRASCRGGFARIYDPRAEEKKVIRAELQAIVKQLDMKKYPEHPKISFIFCMPIPASTPKKDLPLFQSSKVKHEKKSDVDNFIKLYLDCLDGIVFEGDQQVSLGFAIKLYCPVPKTIIIVEETKLVLAQDEVDLETWNYLTA